MVCEFISLSYTKIFMEQFGSTVFGDLRRDNLDRLEAYDDKGIILR